MKLKKVSIAVLSPTSNAMELLSARKDDASVRRRIELTRRWAEVNLFGPSLAQIPILDTARALAAGTGALRLGCND